MTPPPDDPKELARERVWLERIASGDRQAFAEIYQSFSARLYRQVLMPMLGNPAAAEDALAETFRTAFLKIGEFRSREVSLYFWVRRIARNKALDLHRAAKVSGRALARFEELADPSFDPAATPEDLVEEKWDFPKLQGEVRDTLERLNPRYRRAIELRFHEECSREQCARALGVTLGTFDVVLLRALRAFRKQWMEERTLEGGAGG